MDSGAEHAVAEQPKPAFKVAANQVAGHRFEEGRVGSLVDDSGRFYKPLQDGARGDKETLFYDKIWSDTAVPPAVKAFFPHFYGTINIDAPDGSSIRHAIMEDLTHGFTHPCIIDAKIGARTWYPEAGEKYIQKCLQKDSETTSAALGFRLAGMQVYKSVNATVWKAPRIWCKNITVSDVPAALERYVSSNPSDEQNWDAAFASDVYGGTHGAIAQLQELKAWFEEQKFYHFFSASVLIVYEGEPSVDARTVAVKLVDFAHVLYDQDAIDENFLVGLNALIKMLSNIVESNSKVEA